MIVDKKQKENLKHRHQISDMRNWLCYWPIGWAAIAAYVDCEELSINISQKYRPKNTMVMPLPVPNIAYYYFELCLVYFTNQGEGL